MSTSANSITPFLWFNNDAEQAIQFYLSVFKNGKVIGAQYAGSGTDKKLVSATFEINGQRFMALNGGPHFTFNEAVSFFVNCASQEEVDELWSKLSEGGSGGRCGWLKDKYGLSWQIIPEAFGKFMSDKDPEKVKRVMQAMMQMGKLDVAVLQKAYDAA